jgi:hypothetical protein
MEDLPSKFLWSLEGMKKPNYYELLRGRQHNKSSSLNETTAHALSSGVDFILYMDVDMTFPETTIPRLLRHFDDPTVGAVSGLYHLRSEPYSPVCGMFDDFGNCCTLDGQRHWKNCYVPAPRHSVMDIGWSGIGCLMVSAGAIKTIWGGHPFRDEWSQETGTRTRGHDVIFCDEMRRNGKRVLLDTSVDCGHAPAADYIDSFFAEAYNCSNFVQVYNEIKKADTQLEEYWNDVWRDASLLGLMRARSTDLDFVLRYTQPNCSVLDYGAGDGGLAIKLTQNLSPVSVECCDFSEESRKLCRDRGFVSYAPDELGDRLYDYVMCNHVLEHLSETDVQNLIRTLKSHARKLVFISVPGWDDNDKLFIEHSAAYNEETLLALLEPHFSRVSIECGGTTRKSIMAICEV